MIAYLNWRGVASWLNGAQRGVGSVTGLAGTWIFPWLKRRTGSVARAGSVGLVGFFVCLLPTAFCFLAFGASAATDYALMASMVSARWGLWCFDLAQTQIMQEWVAEHERGVMNSMQTATYQLLYVLIQAMGMVFHNPDQFEVLVLFSIGAVGLAVVLFWVWTVRQRAHPLMLASNAGAAAAAAAAAKAKEAGSIN